MVDRIWFPALNVVAHYHADFANAVARPKKVDEIMTVAIAMAGMQEMHKKPYWIQGVPDTEQSPDVRTMCCDNPVGYASPLCQKQDVEVVTYTPYSKGQTLAEFVAATKLAPEAGYDALTTILVNVQAPTALGSETEWMSVLGKTRKKNPVMILGLINKDGPIYRLAVVHPPEIAIDYNPYDLLKKQGYTTVKEWALGTKNKEWYDPNKKHCPFEKFGIECKLLK